MIWMYSDYFFCPSYRHYGALRKDMNKIRLLCQFVQATDNNYNALSNELNKIWLLSMFKLQAI